VPLLPSMMAAILLAVRLATARSGSSFKNGRGARWFGGGLVGLRTTPPVRACPPTSESGFAVYLPYAPPLVVEVIDFIGVPKGIRTLLPP
jgi:hypothetical protein